MCTFLFYDFVDCGNPIISDKSGSIITPTIHNHDGRRLPDWVNCHWEIQSPVSIGNYLQITVRSDPKLRYCEDAVVTLQTDEVNETVNGKDVADTAVTFYSSTGNVFVSFSRYNRNNCYYNGAGFNITYEVIGMKICI